MEMERSENNQFVDTKDAFMHMTIFVSIKTIYSLRISCKKINQWLSDPTSFSWKLRIQNTFPHSYEDILKQTMDDQMRRQLKFDAFVEEGYSVSCCNLIQLSQAAAPHKKVSGLIRVAQLPWQKNIFILTRYGGLCLYDANTASEGQMLEIATTRTLDRKIGIVRNMELKLYRQESTKLVLDRQIVLNYNRRYSALSMFGDNILFKNVYGDYKIQSVSTNSVVLELNYDDDSFEVLSEFTPLIYIVHRNNDDKHTYIKEVNLLTLQCKEFPIVTQPREPFEATGISLIENDRERYLKINCKAHKFGVQVYDVVQQRLIVSHWYANIITERDEYEYERDFWDSLTYNPEMRYYCTSHEGKITIKESEDSLYSQDSAEFVFSTRFLLSTVRKDRIKWLTNDILNMCLVRSLEEDSFHHDLRSVFISAAKKKVIGFINGETIVFSDGDTAIAFDRHTEDVYSITFATASDQETNLKRKLEDPDEQSERKRQKLSNS